MVGETRTHGLAIVFRFYSLSRSTRSFEGHEFVAGFDRRHVLNGGPRSTRLGAPDGTTPCPPSHGSSGGTVHVFGPATAKGVLGSSSVQLAYFERYGVRRSVECNGTLELQLDRDGAGEGAR